MNTCDVYSYGMISASTLHILASDFIFPDADGYGEISQTLPMVGGEAANSSIVLAKLGCSIKIDGNWLGEDDKGKYVYSLLHSYGIDISRLSLKQGYRGVEEIVFADNKTRTVFGTYCHLLFTYKQWNTPVKEDIRGAKVVCLDPFFKEDSVLVAAYCTELGIPYVTVDVKPEDPVAEHASVLIISGEFRTREFKNKRGPGLLKTYTEKVKGTVIFTDGESEILYHQHGKGLKRMAPFAITPMDTTGAGDSFRSGIIYGLVSGWDTETSIRFASALAAMVCTSFPGVLSGPDFQGVCDFLGKRGFAL